MYNYVYVLFFGLMSNLAGYSAIIPSVTLLPSTMIITMRTKIKKKPLSLHMSLILTLHTIASAQSYIKVLSLHLRRFLFYFHNGVA